MPRRGDTSAAAASWRSACRTSREPEIAVLLLADRGEETEAGRSIVPCMSDFHHGHGPQAEEYVLHQKYLTLEGQIDAATFEGNETEVRRLKPLVKREGALDQGKSKSHARELSEVAVGNLDPELAG